jgi:hypothetical protein
MVSIEDLGLLDDFMVVKEKTVLGTSTSQIALKHTSDALYHLPYCGKFPYNSDYLVITACYVENFH